MASFNFSHGLMQPSPEAYMHQYDNTGMGGVEANVMVRNAEACEPSADKGEKCENEHHPNITRQPQYLFNSMNAQEIVSCSINIQRYFS